MTSLIYHVSVKKRESAGLDSCRIIFYTSARRPSCNGTFKERGNASDNSDKTVNLRRLNLRERKKGEKAQNSSQDRLHS